MAHDVSQQSRDDHGRWASRDVSGVEAKACEQAARIFGVDPARITPHVLADLAGATHGTQVSTDHQSGVVHVHINGGKPHVQMMRSFYTRPKPHVFNDVFKVADEGQGNGVGAHMLTTQVETAVKLGVTAIYCDAAGRGDGTTNKKKTAGYYAWARLGYDGPVPDEARERIGEPYEEAEKVSEILAMDGGAEAWLRWGWHFPAKFDCTPGSESLQTLRDYLAEKGKTARFASVGESTPTLPLPVAGGVWGGPTSEVSGWREPFVDDILTDEDEEHLDRVWAKRRHVGETPTVPAPTQFHTEEGGDDRWRGGPRGLERTMPAPHVASPSPPVRAAARRIFRRHTSAPDLARLGGCQDSQPARLEADGDSLLIHACQHTTKVTRKGDEIHVEGEWPKPHPPGHNVVSRQVITRVKAAQKLGVHRVTLKGHDAYNMARFGFDGELTEPVEGHTSALDLLHTPGGHDTWEDQAHPGGQVHFKEKKASLQVHPPSRGLRVLNDYYTERKKSGFSDEGGHDFTLDWEEDEALNRVWKRRSPAMFDNPRLDPSGEFRPTKKRQNDFQDHPDRTDDSAAAAGKIRDMAQHGLEDHHIEAARDSLSSLSPGEAKHAFRSLVKGGHDPDDPADAGAKLAQAIRNSRYYVPPPDDGVDLRARSRKDKTSEKHRNGLLRFTQEQTSRRQGAIDAHRECRRALDEILTSYSPSGVPTPAVRGSDWIKSQSMRTFHEQKAKADAHVKAIDEINERCRQYLMVALAAPDQLRVHVLPPKKQMDPAAVRNLSMAVNFVGKMVARRQGEDGEIPVTPEPGDVPRVDGGTVILPDWSDTACCVHLLGHVLENALPGVKPLCRQYLALRAGRNPPRDLGDFNPAMKGITCRSGRFDPLFPGDKARAMYAGRIYDTGATEILACGLEILYRDPVLFATVDPEYFNFVLMVLRRAIP